MYINILFCFNKRHRKLWDPTYHPSKNFTFKIWYVGLHLTLNAYYFNSHHVLCSDVIVVRSVYFVFCSGLSGFLSLFLQVQEQISRVLTCILYVSFSFTLFLLLSSETIPPPFFPPFFYVSMSITFEKIQSAFLYNQWSIIAKAVSLQLWVIISKSVGPHLDTLTAIVSATLDRTP